MVGQKHVEGGRDDLGVGRGTMTVALAGGINVRLVMWWW